MTKENQFAPDGGVVRSKSSGQSLRQQAEKAVGIAEKLETLPPEEMSRVLHELRVHQIELEMQNEELRRTQKALDASQQRYFDLYYLTPVGYLIVSKQGLVIEANLTATYLLGAVRRELFKQRISRFILKDDQGIYYRKRKDLFESGTQQKCELRMVKKDTTSFWVQLVLAVAIDKGGAPLCRIVLNDITERKLAEEELLKEHNLIANIMETSPVGITTVDLMGKITFANSKAIAILGLSKEDITQMTYNAPKWQISDLNRNPFPDDRLPFNIVMSTGKSVFDVQHAIQWPDGKRILLSINGSPMIDTNGQVAGMVASIEDITKRKQAEVSLHRANRALRMISDCNQALFRATNEVDLLQTICNITVNRGGYRMAWVGFAEQNPTKSVRPVAQAGFEEGYLDTVNITWADTERGRGPTGKAIRTGQHVIACNIPTEPGYDPWRAAAIQRGYTSSISLPLTSGENTFGALSVYATEPYAFNTDEVALLTELVGDLTHGITTIRIRAARVQAEAELRESEERYRKLLEAAPVGIAVHSEGKIVFTNPAGMRLLGGSSEAQIIGRSILQIIHPDRLKQAQSRIQRLLAGEEGLYPTDDVYIKLDGTPIDVEVMATALPYKGNPAVQVIVTDITGRKQSEKLLQDTLKSLRKAVRTTISAMATAAESRDPYTAGHQIRSAGLARAIATEMNLAQDKIDGIYLASSIHDIGKLSIPAEILSKPAKLSDLEFALIKEHAQKGYEILKDVESPWPLAEIVYQHHERMDGSGYPRALKGNDILLEARILNVADVVEAMASHRPYRPALGLDAALEEIEKNKGTFYDEAVGDACLRLFREKGFKLEVA